MAVSKTSNIDILLKEREREHLANVQRKKKAFWMTLGIYALLLLGIFFINIPPKDPPYPVDDEGAVGVLLGTGEEGSGMELGSVMAGNPGQGSGQPQPSENTPAMTAPSEPQPEETGSETGDDPESVAIERQRTQRTQNQAKTQPNPNSNKTTTQTTQHEKRQEERFDASKFGFESSNDGENGANGPGGDKKTSGTGGNGPGSPGSLNGVPNGGGGLGNGGAALGNRRVEFTPPAPNINYQRKGKVIITIIVDRNGNVIETLAAPARGSTITDQKVVDQVRVWAKKFKFSNSSNGLDREQGTVTYVFSY